VQLNASIGRAHRACHLSGVGQLVRINLNGVEPMAGNALAVDPGLVLGRCVSPVQLGADGAADITFHDAAFLTS
jgi:hypothetical protein